MQKFLNGAIVFLIGLSLILLGFYLYSKQKSASEEKSETGKYTQLKTTEKQLFPSINTEFEFKTIQDKTFKIKASNKTFKIDGLEEKLIFLKIFGWECEYCTKEIPELIKLKRDLGDTFDVIAIEAQHSSQKEAEKKVQEYGINYNIVLGDEYQDFYAYLKAHYGWSGIIPLTIVLGKNGKVLAFELGAKSYTLAELMKASLQREKTTK